MKKVLVLICFVIILVSSSSCLKESELPALTTDEVTNIRARSATAGGDITNDGGENVYLRGVCWGTADNPTIKNSVATSLNGTGSFTRLITGLIPDTYYHLRAFALNNIGTAYGNEVHFRTTQVVAPEVLINTSFIALTMIWGEGNIKCDDETAILERGVCWSTSANPTINGNMVSCGNGPGIFAFRLSGLKPGTLYHLRAYAVTFISIAYGSEIQIKTLPLPQVTTASITEFTSTTAKAGGDLVIKEDPYWWGVGLCYGTTSLPTIDGQQISDVTIDGNGLFSCTLKNLTPGTLYYVRAYSSAMDWYDESRQFFQYGNEVTFTTSP